MTSSKTYVHLKEKYDRVVVLIDMDCFYCQVEEFLDPERLTGKPIGKYENIKFQFELLGNQYKENEHIKYENIKYEKMLLIRS